MPYILEASIPTNGIMVFHPKVKPLIMVSKGFPT